MNALPFSPLTTQALVDALGVSEEAGRDVLVRMHLANALTQRLTDGAQSYCGAAYGYFISVGRPAR